MSILDITLKHFNKVIGNDTNDGKYIINTDYGFIVDPQAAWLYPQILRYYQQKDISEFKTFHTAWEQVTEQTEEELVLEQIMYYASRSSASPQLRIPDGTIYSIKKCNLTFDLIVGVSKDSMRIKALNMLNSCIALDTDTVEELLEIYDAYGDLADIKSITNVEASVILFDKYNVTPLRPEDVLRVAVYKATGKPLLIKNMDTFVSITESNYNPVELFKTVTYEKMAEIFNRFRGIFLAFKKQEVPEVSACINRISNLSKRFHKPLVPKPLSSVTWEVIPSEEAIIEAPISKLLNAYQVTQLANTQSFKSYRIRNGKTFTKHAVPNRYDLNVLQQNAELLKSVIRKRLSHLEGKTILMPEATTYGVPVSGKQFVGNVPFGTYVECDTPMIGIHWKSEDGADDMDISAMSLEGNDVSWCTNHKTSDVFFSGDLVTAYNGATEYIVFNKCTAPYIISNNIYNGNNQAKFSITVGTKALQQEELAGPIVSEDDAIHILEDAGSARARQTVIGLFVPSLGDRGNRMYVTHEGLSTSSVCTNQDLTKSTLTALYEQFIGRPTLDDILKLCGAIVTRDQEQEVDIDLANNVKVNSFTDLLQL